MLKESVLSTLYLQVSSKLYVLAQELSATVDQVNSLASASLGNPDTPVGAVVRILNSQLQALNQLEGRVDEMASDVDKIRLGPGASAIAAGRAA
jgi:TolA-binding protein